MEDRIEGAELCHRMDAARQLEKHRSKAAARFLARYRGVSCGHSTGGRPNPADPCSGEDAAGQENAPGPFTQDLLTVLSAVDEDLMARLVRAQTADGSTVIEFLDDVMQDRNDGFRPHHRIAAAKELIVHIVRDEQPEPLPAEASVSSSVRAEPVLSLPKEPVRPPPILPSLPRVLPSFPRRACPVPDTGREPIPGPTKPSLWESPPPSIRMPIPSPLTLSQPKEPN